MIRLWSKTGFRVTAGGFVGLIILLMGLLWHHRIFSYEDYLEYRWLQNEHAVAMELWYGRFDEGTKLKDLLAKFEPHLLLQYDGYVEVKYYPNPPDNRHINLTGVGAIAKDGALIYAGAWCCTGSRTFFAPQSQEERAKLDEAYRRYRDAAAAANDDPG